MYYLSYLIFIQLMFDKKGDLLITLIRNLM